jgi:adenylate cyclase
VSKVKLDRQWSETEKARVRACLDKVLASPIFAQAARQQRFLRYLVDETLEGNAERLKGYTIGVEVFERDRDFDPMLDAIVRVEATRLRAKLREYYDGEGGRDAVRLEVPKGSYGVRIEFPPDHAGPASRAERRTGTADDGRATPSATPASPRVEDRPSVVVLPFLNLSPDPAQQYFADGITEDLTTELSRLSGLLVISRHSAFAYKGVAKRAEEIAGELGVRYLVEGSVQRSADQVRVSAQLIDAASGANLWAERYERELKDVFAVQDAVIRRIVAVLQVRLTPLEQEPLLGHGGAPGFEAHDCLLRGLKGFWSYGQEGTTQAQALFSKAVELDPGYALAHAWLARALVYQWAMLWDTSPACLEQAFEHARAATDLAPQMPYGQAVLCWVQLWRKRGEDSIAAGRRAVAMDPNGADAHLFLSLSLSAAGRGEEALLYIEKGMRLNPHPSSFYQLALGQCYVVLEDYERAIEACRRGVELREAFIPNQFYLCLLYTLLGREDEAKLARAEVLALTGGRLAAVRPVWLDEDLRLRWEGLAGLAGLENA